MNRFFKKTLQGIVLYIHIFTRTPAILLFYSIMLFGVFGNKSKTSSICFVIFLVSILLNVMLVFLFTNSVTKQKSIDLVGFEFYEKYLSHSVPAGKSLTLLLGPTTVAYLYDGTTGFLRHQGHEKAIGQLRDDMLSQYRAGNRSMGDETALLVSAMEKNYVYGGNKSNGLRQIRGKELKETAFPL